MTEQLSTSWHSYPSIFNLGHTQVKEIFEDEVLIEEKVDGSQFSFGKFGDEIKCRSKGAQINTEFPEKMFSLAVAVVRGLNLREGWTYRGEYLRSPKHNSLAYERIPNGHVILFDINSGHEEYLSYAEKQLEAQRLGLELVPQLYFGKVENPEQLISLLETTSILGGQKIEGFVIKNYKKFTADKKAMFGKYVSEHFKEVHSKEWKVSNPSTLGIIETLIEKYKTPARWDKAIIHLKEAGKIEGSPKDIGFLLKEIQEDIKRECEDQIKADLFEWGWDKIRRGTMAGFPEYYKEKLMRDNFK